MKIQVIEDSKGKPTGVFITMPEWAKIQRKINISRPAKKQLSSKDKLIGELKEAVKELVLIEKGQKKARPVEELLNEL
ncbi:MAG: hypothetical protein HYR67_04810 [Bacteroidetes bacterium]|nr:hypothetical protein [Bacteroidota bacterium]